jgi:hypothetical protein
VSGPKYLHVIIQAIPKFRGGNKKTGPQPFAFSFIEPTGRADAKMAEREQLPINGMTDLRESTARPSGTPGVLPAVVVDSLSYEYWWSCAIVSEAFLRVVETQFYIIKKKLKYLI